MTPSAFDFARAGSVEEALDLLSGHDDAKLLAGGHSLIPAMKLRLDAPGLLIDVTGLSDLSAITIDGDTLKIGALVTHRRVELSDTVQSACNVLSEAAGGIGDPQVRNCGTIGGSLAHADPAADYPALVLALDASIDVRNQSGARTIAAADFFTGLFETALTADEIITGVSFPVLQSNEGAAYHKYANPASKYAVVGVAAWIRTDDDGKCTSVRIGVTGASATAHRASRAERGLIGRALGAEAIASATDEMAAGADLLSDHAASADYRAHLVSVMTRRAVAAAYARATA